MTQQNSIKCRIDTPEKTLFNNDIEMCVLTAIDGEWAVCKDHAPSVLLLGNGGIRLKVADSWRHFYLNGGLAEVADNTISVLCEIAVDAKNLSVDDLQKQLEDLKQNLESSTEKRYIQAEIAEIQGKLNVAQRASAN